MGQYRSQSCPVCHDDNSGESHWKGKWTCPACRQLVDVHRELIRNLQCWRASYEQMEIDDVLISESGQEFSLWDVESFYEHRNILAPRMRQAIELCLFHNKVEADAAKIMGIAPSNPVSIYATMGLTQLVEMATHDSLRGYILVLPDELTRRRMHDRGRSDTTRRQHQTG